MVSVLEMTAFTRALPICDLSYPADWTPLNRIYFSQCIQDSDEEQNLSFQRKKKLKRKSCPYKNKQIQRNYIVYEFVSSESDVPASNEFNSADEFESRKSEEEPEILLDDSYKTNKENGSFTEEPDNNTSVEYDSFDVSHEASQKGINVYEEYRPCSDPEVHNSEFNSAQKEEEKVKRKQGKRKRKSVVYQCDSSSKSEEHMTDQQKSVHSSEVRLKEKNACDVYMFCSDPEIHNSELNSLHKEKKVKRKRIVYQHDSSSESEEQMKDQQKSVHSSESNMRPRQLAAKSKKYTTENDDSSEDYEIPTTSEYTSSDDSSSDSSSDYEVSSRKRINQKSKKRRAKKSLRKTNPKTPQLSEYEKMLQKNREEKDAFLESLKLLELKEDFKEAVKILKPKKDKKKNREREISRLKEDSDFSEVEERTGSQVNEETEKVPRQSARRRSLRNKREETIASSQSSKLNKEFPSILSFEEAAKKNYVYHDFISECNESGFKVAKLLDSGYVSHFEKMELQQSQITKLYYGSITSMAVHESQEKIIVCFGNTNGEIIFCHVNTDSDICTFQLHLQSVNNLKFHPYFPNMLISSSTDGTIRCGDFEKKLFYQMFKAESCNHFEFLSPTSYLVAHGIGYVSIVDNRSNRRTFEKRHKCSKDIVKTVDLHPVGKNYFISAHQKGTVKLWDLRKLQDEPVIDVSCNRNMVSAFFSPVTGNSVLVTMSDSICLLDQSSLNEEFKLKKSVELGNNSLWAPIHATWLPSTDDTLVFGSRSSPRIEILNNKLDNIFNFTDESLDCIAPINVFHSSLPFLASATKTKVFIFSETE